ncbi:hypothetical protein L211DRAFT_834465 [Terfezia boudieri ATCC MYA-4762]|uniref:Uncharacterized protein n=1 Tax=Terfezia boudieri ATCC MYA-4762 TaxID=1051890 RepID=A0A3N4LXI2_9PEZI|nr:hypothetical protein L211DRAFT_834465 [Terfezia boudieri ATCC MYA-4762]
MRQRFDDFIESVDLPILYGASAIANHLCIYQYNQETCRLLSRLIPDDEELSIDRAPANRWNIDVLAPEGEQQL